MGCPARTPFPDAMSESDSLSRTTAGAPGSKQHPTRSGSRRLDAQLPGGTCRSMLHERLGISQRGRGDRRRGPARPTAMKPRAPVNAAGVDARATRSRGPGAGRIRNLAIDADQFAEPTRQFVGREAQLGVAAAHVADLDGSSAVGAATGEPGIGKTRLAEESSGSAASGGAGARGRRRGRGTVRRRCGRGCRSSASSPDRRRRSASSWPSRQAASPAARFAQSEAVAEVIRAERSTSPLVVVLDDLQWADPATIRVLYGGRRPGCARALPAGRHVPPRRARASSTSPSSPGSASRWRSRRCRLTPRRELLTSAVGATVRPGAPGRSSSAAPGTRCSCGSSASSWPSRDESTSPRPPCPSGRGRDRAATGTAL